MRKGSLSPFKGSLGEYWMMPMPSLMADPSRHVGAFGGDGRVEGDDGDAGSFHIGWGGPGGEN